MKRVNKNNYYQRLADHLARRICHQAQIPPVKIEVKELRRGGRAGLYNRYISIPLWANRTKEYFIYYVIHEITHFICSYCGHNYAFKLKEQEICKRYNIAIKYSKAYPKYLIRQDTGELICSKYGYAI